LSAPAAASAAARWYSDQVIAQIPRVLTLIDRDPTSPTFGCLDRNYWHYRTQDFPSGMYQELALPLAQVFVQDFPDNPWRGEPRVRELAVAAVRYSRHSAHEDASSDDYYPFERALGATAFVAAAHARVLALLGERDGDLVDFTKRRAWWLVRRDESGRLTNHHALVALAAARAAALGGDEALRAAARERLARCLEWQHAEGWFPEYEGADLGYQSLTIAFLAALAEEMPSPDLDAALGRAASFLAHFLHPDGSLGGEVGSRNTCQVLPSGFERLAAKMDPARYLADGWLAGARSGKRGCADDDRIFCHWMADYPDAYAARAARPASASPPTLPAPAVRTSFPGCGLHVVREGALHLVVGTTKGAAFRAFSGPRLLHGDTGLVLLTEAGTRLVMHVVDSKATVSWSERAVTVSGRFEGTSRKLATPFKQVAFRVVNGTVGRAFPHFVRKTLQKALITGRAPAPYRFERRLSWSTAGEVEVRDVVTREEGAPAIARAFASTDATSIYVATSNLWQDASREPWTELPDLVSELNARGTVEVTRRWR
jgi:hypothetical protein